MNALHTMPHRKSEQRALRIAMKKAGKPKGNHRLASRDTRDPIDEPAWRWCKTCAVYRKSCRHRCKPGPLDPRGVGRPAIKPKFAQRPLIERACRLFAVDMPDLLGRCRKQNLARARFALMLIYRERGVSLNEIGKAFGRDHTTVMNALARADTLCANDPGFKSAVHILRGVAA